MRVLITGGSGLIGGRLAKYLKKKRLKIVIASRKRRFFQGSKFKKINWNSYKNLEKLCQNIDVIINCAGYDFYKSKNKSETFSVNSKNAFQYIPKTPCNNKNHTILSGPPTD